MQIADQRLSWPIQHLESAVLAHPHDQFHLFGAKKKKKKKMFLFF